MTAAFASLGEARAQARARARAREIEEEARRREGQDGRRRSRGGQRAEKDCRAPTPFLDCHLGLSHPALSTSLGLPSSVLLTLHPLVRRRQSGAPLIACNTRAVHRVLMRRPIQPATWKDADAVMGNKGTKARGPPPCPPSLHASSISPSRLCLSERTVHRGLLPFGWLASQLLSTLCIDRQATLS